MYSFCMVLGAHVQDTTSQVRLHLPLAVRVPACSFELLLIPPQSRPVASTQGQDASVWRRPAAAM
jgi:hypothetical protein